MGNPNASDAAALRRALLEWFDANRRPMPWRENPTPYRVWISEVMLQQTQVTTALQYFERFVARFPDLASLAEAEEEEVLALWSGLGYYRRARNLRRAAKAVLASGASELPDTAAALRELPGVGRYTAGAVASIAFGRCEPALDGNAIRLLTRLGALAGDPARQPLAGELWRRLGELVDGERPGDVNQAVMEFAARICRPRSPRCDECSLADHCRAGAAGEPTAYPQLPPRPRSEVLAVEVGIFRRGDELLLCRGERPFLGKLWNLPYRVSADSAGHAAETWARLGLRLARKRRLGRASHAITRYRIEQAVLGGEATVLAREGAPEYRWVKRRELAGLGLSAFTTKLLAAHPEERSGRRSAGRGG